MSNKVLQYVYGPIAQLITADRLLGCKYKLYGRWQVAILMRHCYQGHLRYVLLLGLQTRILICFTGITEAFKADSFPEKINLGVGAYRG